MEMAMIYIMMTKKKQEMEKELNRANYIERVTEDWKPFHSSDKHKVSVFAGRRTKKTVNVLLRALHSPYDCIVYMKGHVVGYKTLLNSMARDEGINLNILNESYFRVVLVDDNNRKIILRHISGYANRERDMIDNWINREVLFDEFDFNEFQRIIERMSAYVDRTRHIRCVGSPNSRDPIYSKMWFKSSDLSYFIDQGETTDPVIPTVSLRPSSLRTMIDNMPGLEYGLYELV